MQLLHMNKIRWIFTFCIFLVVGLGGFKILNKSTFHPLHDIGDEIDSINGVAVYYNGEVGNVSGRHISSDGYNYGLNYQCVEFVKRYYYDHLNHKMPNSYGHAKDFFNPNLKNGQFNPDRNLYQFTNPSKTKAKVNDLLIFKPTLLNPYWHVAIVSNVTDKEIEIVQQNAGAFTSSREKIPLTLKDSKWKIENPKLLGWLRKK